MTGNNRQQLTVSIPEEGNEKKKIIYSPEYETSQQIRKENALKLKGTARLERKILRKTEREVGECSDLLNAEQVLKDKDSEIQAVKLRVVERNRSEFFLERSMQSEETLETLADKDWEIKQLKVLVAEQAEEIILLCTEVELYKTNKEQSTKSTEKSSDFEKETSDSLNFLVDGVKKILSENAEGESLKPDKTKKIKVAGVLINEDKYRSAQHCESVPDCLKELVLGYYDPEVHTVVGCRLPDGVSKDDFVKITQEHTSDILKIAKQMTENPDSPIAGKRLAEYYVFQRMKDFMRPIFNQIRYDGKQKNNSKMINLEEA
ncbi:uncharacterized protein LOC127282322 [Leptopilina boulardi]|uniref:uncharacterized protein LOC127282322 n=1 Tax=Leptopilina boulardi TaxID=63433 RepID=UPI0021F5B428|nr:uncharacterized protein LOC127282322 [Leptopilina boulardi]